MLQTVPTPINGIVIPADATLLAQTLVDPTQFVITDASVTGASVAYGVLDLVGSTQYLANTFPISVVLTTGTAALAASATYTPGAGTDNQEPGSPLIQNSFDAVDLKFTVSPLTPLADIF